MKLYYMPGTCALSDHIALEWVGADFEAVRLSREELKSPAYLAKNPAGSVPALEERDGWVLTENVAILDYIARRHPSGRLGGDDEREHAQVLRWTSYLGSDVHKAFGPIFAPGKFADGDALQAMVRDKAVAQIRDRLGVVERHLAGRTRLVGERPTIADAYLYVILRWTAERAGGLSAFPNLQRFRELMEDDPAVRRALSQQGLD